MALPRDAPMACKPENQATFLRTLNVLRADCIHLLEVHEHDIPDRYWRPGDPAAQTSSPRTANDRSRLKLCLTLTLQPDRKPIFPPSNTRLSDELVYLATKFLKIRERADAYPYDFDVKGDINPSRIPSGVAPLVWAHGLPFFPVYKGYYILCGREHAKWIGWMLNRKEKAKTMSRFPVWTIGPVVAPASAVEMSRTVERQLRVHKATSTRHFGKGEEHRMAATDVVSICHCDLSVVPRTPSVSGGYRVMPIYQVLGYNVRCGPDWNDSRRAAVVDRQVYVERGIDFDYSAALKLPLVNQRCPRAESDETVKHDGRRLEGFLDELSSNEAQDPAHQMIENQGYAVLSSKENPVKDNIPSQTDFTKDVQACEIELNELARTVTDRDADIFEYTKMQPVEWWLDISHRALHALKRAMARLEDEAKQSSGSDLPPRKRLKAETPCAEPKIEEKAEDAVSIYQEQAKPPLGASLEIQSSADIPLLHPHTGNSKTSVTESVPTEINANEASLILGLPDQETKTVNEDTAMGEGVDIHDFHDEYLEHNEQAQETAAEEKLQQESTAKSISSSEISSPTLRVSSRAREMEDAQMVLSTTPEMEIQKINEEAAINAEICRDRVRSPSWTDLGQADTAELAQVTAEDAGDIQSAVQEGENVGG